MFGPPRRLCDVHSLSYNVASPLRADEWAEILVETQRPHTVHVTPPDSTDTTDVSEASQEEREEEERERGRRSEEFVLHVHVDDKVLKGAPNPCVFLHVEVNPPMVSENKKPIVKGRSTLHVYVQCTCACTCGYQEFIILRYMYMYMYM